MADYVLSLNESEIQRYQLMAQMALAAEVDQWAAAGVVPGAVIADVGCGPGAITVELAKLVGPSGTVWAVDQDPEALSVADSLTAAAGLKNVWTRHGLATATGLEPGSVDLVMMRHVLAHNGGAEQAIVDHLASLARPGGAVYLLDIEGSAMRYRPDLPLIQEFTGRYAELHARRGNDLSVGLRLDELLENAGLVVEEFSGRYAIVKPPPGVRPPMWSAKDLMIAEGLATQADFARWEAGIEKLARDGVQITFFAPSFVAVGRRPTQVRSE